MVTRAHGTDEQPFLEGRKYRAEEIGEVMGQRNWWRVCALALIGLLTVALSGLVYLGAQPKLMPVIIKWDSSTGELSPVGVHQRAGEEPLTLRLFLREFVTTLRAISTDKEVMGLQWDIVKKRVTKEGMARLVSYVETRKPLDQTDPVSVEVLHSLHMTGTTWQVRWMERTYNGRTGDLIKQAPMVGSFTYRHGTPRTLLEITYNPVGIFFHEWSWSPE